MTFKALTVRQPWADLLVSGAKDVENRSRKTNYRGPLLIHVSLTKTSKAQVPWETIPEQYWDYATLAWSVTASAGRLLGLVELVDCIRDSDSRWAFDDHWHWLIKPVTIFERSKIVKGKLGLWNCEWP